MELQYIRTCRNQEQKSLKGILDRSEYIELMVRLTKSAYPTMAVGLSLIIIMGLFLKKTYEKSWFLILRMKIRENKPLNKTLYENKHGLRHIFQTLSEYSPGFPRKNSDNYITAVLAPFKLMIESSEIHNIWIYSLEFIMNDKSQQKKYDYLTFTEFLEFIIRIALVIFKHSTLQHEQKVHKMLEMVYAHARILTT